jgi:hypothetical protein
MKRNIERRGRIARAITGLLCIALGVAVWYIGWPESAVYRWIVIILAFAAGVFQLYEAKSGWCAARACGLKTPM